MKIIGTSGHVDHGKSALIQALSSINPMHLPAEKERGMTIDLGFAHFTNPSGENIGIVDVPGHEKFIRNMVAGIWALDCVLLVVALDDGVMPMTQMHLQIALCMKVPKLILVVNKMDLYSPSEAQKRLSAILAELQELPKDTPHIMVSSTTGEGIEDLKQIVFQQLQSLDAPAPSQNQYYVDRVFDIKGTGQVLTGSLVGGSLNKNQEVMIYPSQEITQVKTLQAYHQSVDTALPKSRLSLTLKSSTPIKRGFMISSLKPSAVICSHYLIVKIEKVYQQIKNLSEVEVALGTVATIAKAGFLGEEYLTLELRENVSCLPEQRILLIAHGGSHLLLCVSAIIGITGKKERNRFKDYLNFLKQENIPINYEILSCIHNKGFKKTAEVSENLKPYGIILGEDFILNFILEDLKKQINQAVQKNKGIKASEISSRLEIENSILNQVLKYLVQNNALVENQQGYYPAGTKLDGASSCLETVKLNLGEKNALAFANSMSSRGFKAEEVMHHKATQKDLKNLIALGLVLFLDDNIYMSASAYEILEKQILQNLQIGDKFSIQRVKETTGLSRKYSIPILQMMEKRGYVKRSENERIVLKI